MTRFLKNSFLTTSLIAIAFTVSSANAADYEAPATAATLQSNFSQFTPRPSKKTRLDYGVMDEALSYIVIDLGPSLRRRMQKPLATAGSRFVTGHTSPYRMEGSRVTFDYITDGFLEGLTAYRKDLEAIGTQVDIATLSRDEQLSYWFNLHNLTLLEHIAEAYPTEEPDQIKVKMNGSKVLLHDAKILNVKGQALSLRDIRENIVYKNWSNPNVFYGFYRGTIGSPKIHTRAYAANRVDFLLNESAGEFVNSLRGFRKGTKYRYVSPLFEEMDGTLFKNFDRDLDAHLQKFARNDIADQVASGLSFKFGQYQDDISDLTNGRRLGSSGNALLGAGTMPRDVGRFMAEANEKRETLIRKGLITPRGGYVVIEDLVVEEDEETPVE